MKTSKVQQSSVVIGSNVEITCFLRVYVSVKMFGNWTFGTLVFTVMVITVTLKVNSTIHQS